MLARPAQEPSTRPFVVWKTEVKETDFKYKSVIEERDKLIKQLEAHKGGGIE